MGGDAVKADASSYKELYGMRMIEITPLLYSSIGGISKENKRTELVEIGEMGRYGVRSCNDTFILIWYSHRLTQNRET